MSDNCRLVDCKASDKEIKRKQIFLHNDAPFMDPRLTRKLSYTETHNQRQSEKVKKQTDKRGSNAFGSLSRKQFNIYSAQCSNTEIMDSSQTNICNCGFHSASGKCNECQSSKSIMFSGHRKNLDCHKNNKEFL